MHSIPSPVSNIPPIPLPVTATTINSGGNNNSSSTTTNNSASVPPSETHKCPYQSCGKYFSKKYNLKAHLRLHTGEQPFECPRPDCRKKFKWRSSLSSHSVWHTRKEQKRPRSLINKKARKVNTTTNTNTTTNNNAGFNGNGNAISAPTPTWFNLFQSSPGSPVTSEENACDMVNISSDNVVVKREPIFDIDIAANTNANGATLTQIAGNATQNNNNNTHHQQQYGKPELDVELFDGAVLPPLCTVSVGKMEDELLIHEGDVHAAILADDVLFANDHHHNINMSMNMNMLQQHTSTTGGTGYNMQSRNIITTATNSYSSSSTTAADRNININTTTNNVPATTTANAVDDFGFSITQFDLDNLQPL